MWIRYGLLTFMGLSFGGIVAAGLFTFITAIGILNRLVVVTNTADKVHWYENCVVFGALVGYLCWIYALPLHFGYWSTGLWGLFIGLYVGCLIGAIAEILNAFPVFLRRIHLKKGLMGIVLGLALGKLIGTLWYFF